MSGCALISFCMRHNTTCIHTINVHDAVDKRPFVAMVARMSNTEKPDVATDDGDNMESRLSFADEAEKLLRAILVVLGYKNAGALRGEDLVTGITAWVTLLVTMKREPSGRYEAFWGRAFLDVSKDLPVDDAAECADKMLNQFARRFPPMLDDALLDEQERDTQSDIQVLTAELDKQVQLVWQLEAENKALLGANEHHASELAHMRIKFEAFKDDVRGALGVGSGADMIAIIEARTKQHREYHELKSSTLVPLAKPERIERGQRWAIVMVAKEQKNECTLFNDPSGFEYTAFSADLETSFYLGKDNA